MLSPSNTQEIKPHWKSSGSSHFASPQQSCTVQASNRPTGCPDTQSQLFYTHLIKTHQIIHKRNTTLSPSDCRESFSAYSSLQGHQLVRFFPFTSHFVLGQVQRVSLFPIMAKAFIDPVIQRLEEQQQSFKCPNPWHTHQCAEVHWQEEHQAPGAGTFTGRSSLL